MKVARPQKTIFWLSMAEGSFRTTFYLTGKAEEVPMSSAISNKLKEGLRSRYRHHNIAGSEYDFDHETREQHQKSRRTV